MAQAWPELNPDNLAEHLEELTAQMLTPERLARFREVAGHRLDCLTAACENFHDAHNLNACVRTCEVFGCPEVHIVGSDNYKPSKGTTRYAHRWLTLHRHHGEVECIDRLHQRGYTVIGTLPAGEAVPFTEFPLPDRLCLWLGPEHEGMSAAAKARCDGFVTIPMFGFTRSLNVSVAMAILLQYFAQAYRASGRTGALPAVRQEELIRAWCERDLRERFGWEQGD